MFAEREWLIGAERALFWPAEAALLVADLHLEKASWYARLGSLLPPYDSRETLRRVAAAVAATGARRVFCLGDSFHDAAGPARLDPAAADTLAVLMAQTDWVWITGNHDREAVTPGGTVVDELCVGGIALRHEALPGVSGYEISGHFHPRVRIATRGRHVARPCAVASEDRLILPAFGALTGGLDAGDPAIMRALQPARTIDALVPTARRVTRFALWRGHTPA